MHLPLNGAIVGFGFIAERGHLPAYRLRPDLFSIVAVADLCEARRDQARRAIPGVRVYATADELFALEPDLDFVDIATPPRDHAALAHAALDRGLHVFCEKPLTTSSEEARSLLAHAASAQRVLFPSHNYRHAPVINAVRGLIAINDLGAIQRVDLYTLRPTHAKGTPEWKPDWRRARQHSGGGIAMDHGSHSFYLAFEWLGSYPTAVTACTAHRAGLDTEDELDCTITFPTGRAAAHLTWNADVRKVMYAIHGDRGVIAVEDDAIEITNRTGRTERIEAASHWMDASHAAWFVSLQLELVTAIRDGTFVGRHAIDAFHAVRLIEAAYASAAADGITVNLPATGPLARPHHVDAAPRARARP
jgi:predicted dehydrogenase